MTFWTDLLGLEFEVSYVDANGINTRRLLAGKGEDVVFLHGITGHFEAFVSVVPHFVKAGFRVHMIDMLAQGFTDATGENVTVDSISRHLVDYLDACGIAKAHIVGLSLGGWTTALTAANFPDRVLSATLIAPAGDPNALPGKDPKFSEMMRKTTIEGVMSPDKELTRKRLETVVARPEALTEEIIDIRYAVYHRPTFQSNIEKLVYLFDMDVYNGESLKPEILARIKCPTLVIFGEDDPGGGGTQYLSDGIANVKVMIFEGTGHWPAFERPDDFARVAIAFMREGLGAVEEGRLKANGEVAELQAA